MEFLKLKFTVLLCVFTVTNLLAQESLGVVEEAFAKSYKLEKDMEYIAAANQLLIVYDKTSYEINLRIGWLFYNAGHFEKSVLYYSVAHELKPYAEEARLGLVLPKAAMGLWNDVIEIYSEILNIHPNNTVVMYRLGLIYYERKNYDKALPLFKKIVDLYPFDYNALLMLAWTSYAIGNYNQAKVLFNKVKLYNPGDSIANKGLQLMKLKN